MNFTMFTHALENVDPHSDYSMGFVLGVLAVSTTHLFLSYFCNRRQAQTEEDDDEVSEGEYEDISEDDLTGSYDDEEHYSNNSNSYEEGNMPDYHDDREEDRIRDSTSLMSRSGGTPRERSVTPPPPMALDGSESFSTYLRGLATGLHATPTEEPEMSLTPSATRSID